MCIQICSGVRFLHAHDILHRDISCRNMLLTFSSTVKVSDFGLSRIAADTYYAGIHSVSVPVKWTALEAMERQRYSVASDVFALGVCLWEVLTFGKVPWAGYSNAQVLENLRNGSTLHVPQCIEAKLELWDMMVQCWDKDPKARPSISQLQQSFEQYKTKKK